MIINKTPHPIVIVGDDNGKIKTFASAGSIRLEASTKGRGEIDGVPITKTVFGEPEGLPPFEEGTYYIVSQLVKTACTGRTDLMVPAEVVRDDTGAIIGCRSLGV